MRRFPALPLLAALIICSLPATARAQCAGAVRFHFNGAAAWSYVPFRTGSGQATAWNDQIMMGGSFIRVGNDPYAHIASFASV